MQKRVFHRILLAGVLCLVSFAAPSQKAGALPLRPGEEHPQPRQRGLNEIEAIPTREAPCPVCSFVVVIPEADTLMRQTSGKADRPAWRRHYEERDADLCPHPGRGKVDFQADIVVCPSCGYTRRQEQWDNPVSAEEAEWVRSNLRPALREAFSALLGKRAGDMDDNDKAVFFNRQETIPDTLRTEFHRIRLAAAHAPALEQAEACLLAAWAARREVARLPKGDMLAKHAAAVFADLDKTKRAPPGIHRDIDALRTLLTRRRQGKTGLPGGYDMAGRLILAGLWDRLGFLDETEAILGGLYEECRERFHRLDQDPLWSDTNSRASRSHRQSELEVMRGDAEREVLVRLSMARRERELLTDASRCIREAFRNGEFDNRPADALFHAYIMGECLRRAGDLPLASEWFKNLQYLAAEDSHLARAAAIQLKYVDEEAGDRINLFSALGRDGELFDKLRAICGGARK